MKRLFSFHFLLLLLAFPVAVSAQPSVLHPSGLPLPRFVSLKANKAYMRVGPGQRYPIHYVYTRRDLPVKILEEFAHWRKVQDVGGESGWMHKNLLSGKRTAMVIGGTKALYQKPDVNARQMVRMKEGFIGSLVSCLPDWCEMRANGFKGWINKADIYGTLREEVFE